MTKDTNNYGHPNETLGIVTSYTVTRAKSIASLTKRLAEDINRWRGKKTPESVKEDRKNKRKILDKLLGKHRK